MKKKRTLCYLCDKKPAKVIKTDRRHATKSPAFCSLRHAAYYGLIKMEETHHLCPTTHQWEFDEFECSLCKEEE
jgi:hypothetical protein